MAEDDDPTSALDDFVQRMRPKPPDSSPFDLSDLSDLIGRLAAERPSVTAARARGSRLRSGEAWHSDDVVDVPHVEIPVVAPADRHAPDVRPPPVAAPSVAEGQVRLPAIDAPPPPAATALDAACRIANDAAAAQFDDRQRADASWQPDVAALVPAAHVADGRLLREYEPGAWTGARRRVMAQVTEFVTTPDGTAVETYPAHWLLALWPPQRLDQPLLGRWPAVVRLCAAGADDAAGLLLEAMPAGARLWLSPQAVDWGLIAEVLLHHDPTLRPFQLKGLRAFVEAERDASFARINSGYHQPLAGGRVQQRD